PCIFHTSVVRKCWSCPANKSGWKAVGLCKYFSRNAVNIFFVQWQYISGYCCALGDEFLEPSNRKDGRWMDVYLYGGENPRYQTNPSAFALDERLWSVQYYGYGGK